MLAFWLCTEIVSKYENLLGARLASTPATDKVNGCGALRDPLHIRLIQIIQLVGQASALGLLAPFLQATDNPLSLAIGDC